MANRLCPGQTGSPAFDALLNFATGIPRLLFPSHILSK